MKLTDEQASELTKRAFSILVTWLELHNNKPNDLQKHALFAIIDAMTNMASGSLTGRWAFGLQTGFGKSSCVLAWIAALTQLGHHHISAAVASEEVDALCDMWESLLRMGVPEAQLGILHRKPLARIKPTTDYKSKPILLICHARVRNQYLDQFNSFDGRPRDLLIYDESLVATYSSACASPTITALAGGLSAQCQRYPDYRERMGKLSAFLSEYDQAIFSELQRLTDIGSTQSVIRLPERSVEELEELAAVLPDNETVQSLIEMAPYPVKVSNFAEKGVVSYQVSIPASLRNVLVLDASQPIRDLVKFDRTVLDAEEHLPKLKALGVPLASLKRYDGTTVYRMKAHGGKTAMTKSFKQADRQQRSISREIVNVIKNHIPPDEAVLIVAFKAATQRRGGVDFVKTIREDLAAAGVDLDAVVPMVGEGGKVEHRPRINITTWGKHTGTNRYGYCQNEIQVGIVHRDLLDLFGNYLGQVGDINAQQDRQRLLDLQLSEVAHACFQAINRCQCRTVIDGQAKPVRVWLIHYSRDLEKKLAPVLEGAEWKEWKRKYPEQRQQRTPQKVGQIQTVANTLRDYLTKLPEDVLQVSTRQAKKDLALTETPMRSFTCAVQLALEGMSWLLVGRSLVRARAYFNAA